MYVSVNYIIIGLYKGISAAGGHAITWINASLFQTRPQETVTDICIKMQSFSLMNINLKWLYKIAAYCWIGDIFSGMVQRMDQAFGEVVQALKDAGLYENSIIIFTSDVRKFFVTPRGFVDSIWIVIARST